jgi:site-specific recombinase XerD
VGGFERHLLIQNRTERTLNGYQESVSKLAEHLVREEGTAPDLLLLERRQLESFVLMLQAKRYAPNTVLRHFRGLATFFSWLTQENLIERCSMERLRPPRVNVEPPPVLPSDAVGRLLEVCEGRDFEA